MGTLPRCLCPILTLLIAGLRPSAGVRNGSLESDPWWGTKDARRIHQAFERARKSGDFAALEREATNAANLALRRRASFGAVRYLMTAGAAKMAQFRYRAALETLLDARKLAEKVGDRVDESGIEVNLSSLYFEMSDFESAQYYAEQAFARSCGLIHPYFEHHLLLQLGKIYALKDDPRAENMFRQGIEAARAQGDAAQEARGWDLLGARWLRSGQSVDAERAFTEAYRIRKLRYPAELPFSWEYLGSLRLAQGRLQDAARFTALAIGAARRLDPAFPLFLLIHQRGEIYLADAETRDALRDFETSAELASQWRVETLPAVSTLTATNIELEKRIFKSLVETAAHEAVVQRNSQLEFQSFQALEENRAAGLREALALGGTWKNGLPVQYWDVLGEIRAEQGRLMRGEPVNNADLEEAKVKLTEMEAAAGLRFPNNKPNNKAENFRSQNSLIHFRQVLSNRELFLSFHLGERESYVWALTRGSFHLYRLAPAAEIRGTAQRFREAVRAGSPDMAEVGQRLYRQLFGELGPLEARQRDWVISAEDVLFETPLAALVTERKVSGLTYLIEQHSLRLVPGAMSLGIGQAMAARGEWLGIGDPVYNTADRRWTARTRSPWFAQAAMDQFNRLVGSGAELRASARSWGGASVILEGLDATLEKFQAAVSRHPAVVHLATHVLAPAGHPGQAMIALGLDGSGKAQFLTTADIAAMRLPGAVVTMAGCATGTGEIQPGAGLLGLTRAWQLAGAAAVIATLWPVPDSKGDIFPSFYRYLREMPPAEALRQSQIEMIRGGTWRASPQNWGSYQLNGGAQ